MHCKAVILAAGMGQRLSPLTPSVPKELLPIGGFPAIHHVVYELAEMGVSEVRIVLSEGKDAVRDYFTKAPTSKGDRATRLSQRLTALLSRVQVSFSYQKECRGTGDAVLQARDFAGDDDLIVAYPDDLMLFDGGYGRLPDGLLSGEGSSMILTRTVSGEDAANYGVVIPAANRIRDAVRVDAIVEKPQNYSSDTALVLVGRMRLTKESIDEIARHPLTDSAGITLALNAMAGRGKVLATVTHDAVYDVGSHDGYIRTAKDVAERVITDYERERIVPNMSS